MNLSTILEHFKPLNLHCLVQDHPWVLIQRPLFDVFVNNEPYLVKQVIFNFKTLEYLVRICGRTHKRGEAKDVQHLEKVCDEVFYELKICQGFQESCLSKNPNEGHGKCEVVVAEAREDPFCLTCSVDKNEQKVCAEENDQEGELDAWTNLVEEEDIGGRASENCRQDEPTAEVDHEECETNLDDLKDDDIPVLATNVKQELREEGSETSLEADFNENFHPPTLPVETSAIDCKVDTSLSHTVEVSFEDFPKEVVTKDQVKASKMRRDTQVATKKGDIVHVNAAKMRFLPKESTKESPIGQVKIKGQWRWALRIESIPGLKITEKLKTRMAANLVNECRCRRALPKIMDDTARETEEAVIKPGQSFVCKCGEVYPGNSLKLDGYIESSPGLKKVRNTCSICRRGFRKGVGAWAKHMVSHEGYGSRNECKVCGFRTNRFNNLKVHTQTMHVKAIYKLPCELCGMMVWNKSDSQRRHRFKFHQERLVCQLCGEQQPDGCALKRHVLVHLPFLFACRFCDKRLKRERELEAHERTHTGERPYACEVCGRAFVSVTERAVHRRVKHGMGKKAEMMARAAKV